MANQTRCLWGMLSVGNLLMLILAIIIMSLSLGNWNDYATCSLTIVISVCWICCICVENNVLISCYTAVMVIDMLLLLANGIFYAVITKKFDDFCGDTLGRPDGFGPEWGCHDWRQFGRSRTIGMIVCFFLAFLFRLGNIVGSCMLANRIFHDTD